MRYDFSQKPCLQTEADGIDVEQPTEIEAVSAN